MILYRHSPRSGRLRRRLGARGRPGLPCRRTSHRRPSRAAGPPLPQPGLPGCGAATSHGAGVSPHAREIMGWPRAREFPPSSLSQVAGGIVQANPGEVCLVPKNHVSLPLDNQLVGAGLTLLITAAPSARSLFGMQALWERPGPRLPRSDPGKAGLRRAALGSSFAPGAPDNVVGAAGGRGRAGEGAGGGTYEQPGASLPVGARADAWGCCSTEGQTSLWSGVTWEFGSAPGRQSFILLLLLHAPTA